MEKFTYEGNKVFIDWFPTPLTLVQADNWINKIRAKLDPEEEIIIDVVEAGQKGVGGLISAMTSKEIKNLKIPNQKKPCRIRLANCINFIMEIYDTLRKLNFAINLNLKEDIVSETIIYFMNRWDKYEYHPRCVPIAVQKYKSTNIDVYRKEKKQINVDTKELDSFLPQSLGEIEGLPLKELEKKENFKRMKEAISKMDESCRELLMYVADDKSESEIQKILDIPLGTVASRKSNCIKKLAELLKI